MAATATTAPASGRRSRRLWNQEAVEGYVCILPWLIGFLAFVAGPMIAALVISFTHWSLLAPPEWIGLENYERLVADPMFRTSLCEHGVHQLPGGAAPAGAGAADRDGAEPEAGAA